MSSLSSSKKKFTIYQLAFTALMAALVFVSTQFNIKIPLGMGVTSMISFGNIFCILSALLLGPIYGGLAAGIGSFFFDLLDPVFITSAPFTLVFKFIMAFVCGKIAYSGGHTADSHKRNLIASIAGLLAYIPLHELVHGLCMKYFGAKKVHSGYAGVYAWAGSKAYFGRKSYIVIALAPLVFWGLVLAALCIVAPAQWFWVFYLVQVTNVSGAAGDFYIAWKAARMPAGVLVQDTGLEMTFYAPPPA